MTIGSRRIIATLLLLVTVAGLVMSFGESVVCAGELPVGHDPAQAFAVYDSAQVHDSGCPCAPSPSHSDDDHFCTGDCGCPCQAPLSSAVIVVSYSPQSASLHYAEVTRHTPEVYLSLFVPPDSAVI